MAFVKILESAINISSTYLTIILLLITVVWYLYRVKKDNLDSPPGPKLLPWIGTVVQVGSFPHLTFMKWAKQYGPIVNVTTGNNRLVVLNDPAHIKELFSQPVASGRNMDNPVFYELPQGNFGVIASEGDTWERQRRFTLKTLRNFGFAKRALEEMIMDDVTAVLDWLKQRENTLISGNRIFNAPVVNTLWNIVNGERLEWEKNASPFVEKGEQMMKALERVTSNGLFFAPFLRLILPERTGWNDWVKSINDMNELTKCAIDKHSSNFNEYSLSNYIDCYLNEIKSTTEAYSSFYKENGHKNLTASVLDLFFAGSETTATTLTWALQYLSQHQGIQSKVHEEIDRIVGSSVTPSLSHREKMPYVSSVLLEILRFSSVIPLGIPHRLFSDFTFHGYKLKKNTVIVSNLYGVHHDPTIWGDADVFRPERFLNEDGTKVVKREALIPFSEGKRKCIGETLARDTLFLYFTTVFQQFQIFPECEEQTPNYSTAKGVFLLAPDSFKIILKSRSN